MKNILRKEIKLSTPAFVWFFIAFGLMFFLPGYPVLCGAFFVTLGLFQAFQNSREANDIVYSVLLPVSKKEVVRGKYLLSCLIELSAFLLMGAAALIRMTLLCDAEAYRTNALMNANLFALGMALVIFGLFNFVFIGGFFKTAYKFAGPFVKYIIISMLLIFASESLHYIPGLENVNSFGTDCIVLQIILLCAGAAVYAALTYVSYRLSAERFEKIDL